MLIKQLAHTGGLTITGKKELIFLVTNTVNLGQLCHKPTIILVGRIHFTLLFFLLPEFQAITVL